MFSVHLHLAEGILNSLICVTTFLTILIVHSLKMIHENNWCSSSIACQNKRTDWMLRIFTINDKNPLYLPIISTLQNFLRVKLIKE